MTKFKQIIGRGTRINEEYGKVVFYHFRFQKCNRLICRQQFDGDPIRIKPVTEETDLGSY
jgi:type I restriction enzyme R subunit